MKKKIFCAIMIGIMTLTLLMGCSSQADTAQDDIAQADSRSEEASDEETQGDAKDEDAKDPNSMAGNGKILVVYYSASGNTERVAGVIADTAGADVFKVEPQEPYTDADLDWTDEESRVSVEHENEDKRAMELVSTEVENWDSYDTVFIGYPIWWGIAAWPLDGFVKANDFTGKTVIPFCTSSASDLGDSGKLLADMAGTGEWQEGQRFQSSASEGEVQKWVNGLGILK